MNLKSIFKPQPTLTDEDVAHGLRLMTWEGIVSQAMFSVTTSGVLAAFALALGANNLEVGILAAIPFITQLVQIPAIVLVERLRRRKAIALASWGPAQLMWIPVALIPFIVSVPSNPAVLLLLGLMAIRGIPAAVANCSYNSWARDLIPRHILGDFFSRRLALSTVAAILFGLAGAFVIDFWPRQTSEANGIFGYTLVLLTGAVFLGLASPLFMLRITEPLMPPVAPPYPSVIQTIITPLKDRNFRQLLNFLIFWGFASNLVIPFFTIFMLQRLGFPLSAVIGLNTLSQLTFVVFIRVWGRFADQFGSKVILSLSASLYVLVILGWVFTTLPEPYFFTVPLVVILQIFAGVAASGVNLTVSAIGLKLAPEGQATPYMAAASLATGLGTGLGPIAGGLLADYFSTRRLSIALEWADSTGTFQAPGIHLIGFDFLFVLAGLIGLVTLNTLTSVREEGEVGREVVLEELLGPMRDEMTRVLGSIPGLRLLGRVSSPIQRVPGMDVALGVAAYQIASSVRTAVSATSRGGNTVADVSRRVSQAVSEAVTRLGGLRLRGADVARHSARGAIIAVDDVDWDVGELAKAAVLGSLIGLEETVAEPLDLLWEASYGAVQGAGEAGEDVAEAATQAVAGARQGAQELGIPEEEAARQAVQGALEAARDLSPEALALVEAALRI